MTAILSEWTDALRVPLYHKRHQQCQGKEQDIFFSTGVKAAVIFYSYHRRLLRFCFSFTFVNWLHLFPVGKLNRYFRSIKFLLYVLNL